MAYRGTEAYDFSLFEPQIIEQPKIEKRPNVKPNKKGAPKKAAPVRRAKPADKIITTTETVKRTVDTYQSSVNRNAKREEIPLFTKKILAFFAVCFALLTVLLAVDSKNDSLMSEIASVQKEIEIAEGESVRLNAELSSKISTDKVENYAEDVLGMVKAENYQISYIDLSHGDEIVVSGNKTLSGKSELAGKIKALFAYIF